MYKFVAALGNHLLVNTRHNMGNHLLVNTRHNMGMICLDYHLKRMGGTWTFDRKLKGYFCRINDIVYYKPKEYMNLNGNSISDAMIELKISFRNILIVHDDLDGKLGRIKLKSGGSAEGHNGVKSIISKLNTKDFDRLMIGIGRPVDKSMVPEYVLEPFDTQQLQQMDKILENVHGKLLEFQN